MSAAYYCVEDQLSRSVAERLASEIWENTPLTELNAMQGGFGAIRARLKNYLEISLRHPVLLITDLDNAACAPSLRRDWLVSARISKQPPKKFVFRIAVREIESWIFADSYNISEYVGITPGAAIKIAHAADPKTALLAEVRRGGNRTAKLELLPSGKSRVGIGYNNYLSYFVENLWSYQEAAEKNESLQRTISRMEEVRSLGF